MFKLLLLMILLPALELTLLIKVHGLFSVHYGSFAGLMFTIGVIVCTGVLGANLARQQGFQILKKVQENINKGIAPTGQALDGMMILVGGAMLLTPGFVTDFAGLTMLFPPTRAAYKKWLTVWLTKKIKDGSMNVQFGTMGGGAAFRGGFSSGGFTNSQFRQEFQSPHSINSSQRINPGFSNPPNSASDSESEIIDAEIVKD